MIEFFSLLDSVYDIDRSFRYKYPVSDEDTSFEESRPMPFHFEYKTPVPTSFKRPKYPQLAPYRYPQSSNNIQDIIKYLTKENENPKRGIKFSGVYVNPKKFDYYPEAGEMMSNSDRSEEENASPFSYSFSSDPFHQYKPKNPSDVNLLATSNVRYELNAISITIFLQFSLARPDYTFNVAGSHRLDHTDTIKALMNHILRGLR